MYATDIFQGLFSPPRLMNMAGLQAAALFGMNDAWTTAGLLMGSLGLDEFSGLLIPPQAAAEPALLSFPDLPELPPLGSPLTQSSYKSPYKTEDSSYTPPAGASDKLKEALQDYDSDVGKKLSDACKEVAGNKEPAGMCPEGPSQAISKILGLNFSANGGEWDKLAEEHPDKFKKVEVTVEDLKFLPPGCIVNYDRGQGTIGHVTMTDGKGGSDCDGHESQVPMDSGAKITVLIPIKKKK